MNLEIHNPELAQRVRARIQSGHFHDADELIEKALDALDEQATVDAPGTATGAVVLAALQASPYRDIDLTPPRVRLTNVRDVVLSWLGCSTPIREALEAAGSKPLPSPIGVIFVFIVS